MSARRTIDVDGPIRVHLNRAHRQFDAAMDALVPPSPEQLAARSMPAAVGLAQLVHAWNTAMGDFGLAFSSTLRNLERTASK